jgi:hypothetical protein
MAEWYYVGNRTPAAEQNTTINVLQNYCSMKTRVKNMTVIKRTPL